MEKEIGLEEEDKKTEYVTREEFFRVVRNEDKKVRMLGAMTAVCFVIVIGLAFLLYFLNAKDIAYLAGILLKLATP